MPVIQIIVNPQSGSKKGLKILQPLITKLMSKGYTVEKHISQYHGHPLEIAKSLDLFKDNMIVVIGGDGTMHEVINGMMSREDNRRVPLALIAAGTGNSLMNELEAMNSLSPLEKIIRARTKNMDLIEIEQEGHKIYAFNILGWGIPAYVNMLAEKMRILAGQRYNIASVFELLKNKTEKVTIHLDQQVRQGEYSFILACNTKYTGKGMKMSPDSTFDDGVFEVILTKKLGRIKLIRLFINLFRGTHLSDPDIELVNVRSLAIHSENKLPLNIDGQVKGFSPFKATIIREAIKIIV